MHSELSFLSLEGGFSHIRTADEDDEAQRLGSFPEALELGSGTAGI